MPVPTPQESKVDVLVIGAGNTAIDVCQDLATSGVGSVTMVQRSSTCIVSRSHVRQMLEHLWPPGVPTDVCDLKVASVPTGFLKKTLIAQQEQVLEDEEGESDHREARWATARGCGRGSGRWRG